MFFCVACSTSYSDAAQPPERCVICDDERQFVPTSGQAWITREALHETHTNAWQQHEADLLSRQTTLAFAISQRAFLPSLAYRRIYGVFTGLDVIDDGPAIVARSAARYVDLLENLNARDGSAAIRSSSYPK